MTLQELLFLLVVFIANTFEAMTGFAGTLLAMPASIRKRGLMEGYPMVKSRYMRWIYDT